MWTRGVDPAVGYHQDEDEGQDHEHPPRRTGGRAGATQGSSALPRKRHHPSPVGRHLRQKPPSADGTTPVKTHDAQ